MGFACYAVENNVQNTINSCYYILEKPYLSREFKQAALIVAKSMENQKVQFSGSGCFNVSRNIISVIFVNIINYLIIIMQIQKV